MSIEERVGKMERRVQNVEEAIALLTALITSHDDRLEDSVKDGENLEAKISALIDAQIRSEDKISGLAERQDKTEALMQEVINQLSNLAERQSSSETRLESINNALDKLTELAKNAHQRLDRLES
jgi:chromosome segregation ATPase